MDTRVQLRYYRVPSTRTHPRRGEPETSDMFQYSRGNGWQEKASGVDGHTWENIKPYERGGMTQCNLIDEGGSVVGVGIAVCSWADNFNYRIGRAIAVGRAAASAREAVGLK